MRVDFYQLGQSTPEQLIVSLGEKLLAQDERLLVVAEDEGQLARLDRLLWDQGATSFVPHGLAGSGKDSEQPILLSTGTDAPNRARNLLLADGEWREAALGYERAFYLFDASGIEAARLAWKLLSGREGVERHYWAQGPAGKWEEKA